MFPYVSVSYFLHVFPPLIQHDFYTSSVFLDIRFHRAILRAPRTTQPFLAFSPSWLHFKYLSSMFKTLLLEQKISQHNSTDDFTASWKRQNLNLSLSLFILILSLYHHLPFSSYSLKGILSILLPDCSNHLCIWAPPFLRICYPSYISFHWSLHHFPLDFSYLPKT